MSSDEAFFERTQRARDLMVRGDPKALEALENERRQLADSRRLYSDDSGEPTFKKSFAFYLDHLGTKQQMNTFTSEDLHAYLRLIDAFIWTIHDPTWQAEDQALSTFSDNFILGVIFDENRPGGCGLTPALGAIAFYELVMATEKIPMRGGIALGDLYMDERTVIGPALVEAVELEEHHAKYPRIILSKDCIKVVQKDLGYFHADFRPFTPWNDALLVDADGEVFVSYLSSILEIDNKTAQSGALSDHRDAIRSELYKNHPDPIRMKWRWLADYHNYFCRLYFNHDPALVIVDGLTQSEQTYPRIFRPLAY